MQAYGADLPKSAPIVFNASVVTLANATASFSFGLPIFMFIGFLAREEGVPIDDISSGGFGLVFTTMPKVLTHMAPGLANIMGLLFFFMITTLGLSSSISLLQALTTLLGDLYPEQMIKHRKRVLVGIVVVQYLFSMIFICEAGYSFIDIVDTFLANYQTILTGIFEVVVVCYVMRGGVERIYSMVNANSKTDSIWKKTYPFLVFSTKYVIPSALTWMIIENVVNDAKGRGIIERHPDWGVVVFGYVIIVGLVALAPMAYTILFPIDVGAFADDDDEDFVLSGMNGGAPKIEGGTDGVATEALE
jgi:NSS family neurotransmitter:Na+ symporter